MIEDRAIIEAFVARWVLRNRRERALFELMNENKRCRFAQRLNHNWDTVLDMRFLIRIEKGSDQPEAIKLIMKMTEDQPCYAISNYSEFDRKVMPFGEVFGCIHGRGLASILVGIDMEALYLETEQVYGPPARFAAHWKSI